MSSFKINGFNRRINKSVQFVSDPKNGPKGGVLGSITNSRSLEPNQMSGPSVKKSTVSTKKKSNSSEFKENQTRIRKYAAEQGDKYQEKRNEALLKAIKNKHEAALAVLESIQAGNMRLEDVESSVKRTLGNELKGDDIVNAIKMTDTKCENIDEDLFISLLRPSKLGGSTIKKDNVVAILKSLNVTKKNFNNIDILFQLNIQKAITPDNVAEVIKTLELTGQDYNHYPIQYMRNSIEDNITPENAGDIALALGATSKEDLSVLPKELKVALEAKYLNNEF